MLLAVFHTCLSQVHTVTVPVKVTCPQSDQKFWLFAKVAFLHKEVGTLLCMKKLNVTTEPAANEYMQAASPLTIPVSSKPGHRGSDKTWPKCTSFTCGWSEARDALESQPTIESGLAAVDRFWPDCRG